MTERACRGRLADIALSVIAASVLVVVAADLFSISRRSPFYFIWDMDSIVVHDTLLANSGRPPDHVLHPCVGMYLVTTTSSRWGAVFGRGWTVTLEDLRGALNPLACVAELTDVLRTLSPILCLVGVFLLWLLVWRLGRPVSWLSLAALSILAVQGSWIYHAAMIRSELYAVVFFAGGFLVAAGAASSGSSERIRSALMAASGVLLGLAFLTKVQAAVHVACCICVVAWYGWSRARGAPEDDGGHRTAAVATGLFSAGSFAALLLLAFKVEIPPGVPTWTTTFGFTLQAAVGVGAPLLAAGMQMRVVPRRLAEPARDVVYLGVGAVASFLLAALVPSDPLRGGQYLLTVVKMVFLRPAGGTGVFEPSPIDGLAVLGARPFLVLAATVLCATLLFVRRFDPHQSACTALRPTALIMCALGLAEAFLVLRPIQRDQLWLDTLLVPGLLVGAAVVNRWDRGSAKRLVLAAVLVLLAVDGIGRSRRVPGDLEALYAEYGWRPSHAMLAAYDGSQPEVEATVLAAYSKVNDPRFRWWLPPEVVRYAVDHRKVLFTARFVAPSRQLEQRHLGVLWEGMRSSTASPTTFLAAVPDDLRGALVVDVEGAAAVDRGRRDPRDLGQEWLVSAPVDSAERGTLVLLPRTDLEVYVFEGPAAGSADDDHDRREPTITEHDEHWRWMLAGRLVEEYTELPPLPPGRRRLVVVAAPALL